ISVDDTAREEHVEASRGEYNVHAQTGKFYDVTGAAGVRFRGKNATLVSDDPFTFTGKVVERVSKDRYVITDGTVTSCALPQPKWTFCSHLIVINMVVCDSLLISTIRLNKSHFYYLN